MSKNILIIAGEPSGDVRAGELLKELKKVLTPFSFWGIGGDAMREEGVELVEHIRELSVVGVWEVVKNIAKIRGHYKKIAGEVLARKPSCAILVDYPGFNLRVASFLRKNNIPVIYYILPQVWAWGAWRVKSIKKTVDKALVLFGFEKEFLSKHGVASEFVGHPLVDAAEAYKSTTLHERRTTNDAFTIALLPGSRKSEIENIFPVLLDTAEILRERMRGVSFLLAENTNIDKALYNKYLEKHPALPISRGAPRTAHQFAVSRERSGDTFSCLDKCDFAVVASGTATLETALMGKPMIIVYKAASISRLLAKLVMTVPFFGLVNIMAKEEISPEMIQENMTAEKISARVLEIINNPERLEYIKKRLGDVRELLGEKGASKRAALAIKSFIESNNLDN